MVLKDVDLLYARARIDNPEIARFMQMDPIGYQAGPNLYAYVGGDPINLVDPSGLNPDAVCIEGNCSGSADNGTDEDTIVVDVPGRPTPDIGVLLGAATAGTGLVSGSGNVGGL